MARPDMTKTIAETFERKPSQEEIEALLKKPVSNLTDEERGMVEDYHLAGPFLKKPSETPSAVERAAAGTVDTLTRFGEEVGDLPAELYQSSLERKGAEERRMAEVEAGKRRGWETAAKQDMMVPNKPTPEGWAALREIDAEIERLQQSRKESSNPGEVYWEIEKLKKKRQQIPGVVLPPADMEDEGARTSYEDYLLRK